MRFLALVFTALTILATLIDWAKTHSPADGTVTLRPIGAHWFDLHPASIQLLQPAVERHLAPVLWSGVIQPILEQPATIAFGAAALFFFALSWLLGRRKRKGLR